MVKTTSKSPTIGDLRSIVTGRALTLVEDMLYYPQSDGWIFKETDRLDVLKPEFSKLRQRRNCGRRTEAEILLAVWVLGIDLVEWEVLPGRYRGVRSRFETLLKSLPSRAKRLKTLVRKRLEHLTINHPKNPL